MIGYEKCFADFQFCYWTSLALPGISIERWWHYEKACKAHLTYRSSQLHTLIFMHEEFDPILKSFKGIFQLYKV